MQMFHRYVTLSAFNSVSTFKMKFQLHHFYNLTFFCLGYYLLHLLILSAEVEFFYFYTVVLYCSYFIVNFNCHSLGTRPKL